MSKRRSFRSLLRVSASLIPTAFLISPIATQAQTVGAVYQSGTAASRKIESRNVLEQVVVTASRKRREDVQRTPVAVTAISAVALEKNHVTGITQIGNLAPNLQIVPNVGSSANASFYLRGFGQQSNDLAVDPRIAVFIDGIYQPADVGTMFDLFDVSSLEVQAGPQGTLLGKNAPVGAIYITSAEPTDRLSGNAEASYGSYNHYTVKGRINVPLLKDSAGQTILTSKIAISQKSGGNWVYNAYDHGHDFGGENTTSYRVALAFKPTLAFSWNIFATYTHDSSPLGDHESANYTPGIAGTSQNDAQDTPYPCLLGALVGLKTGCEHLPYGVTDINYTEHGKSDKEDVASSMRYDFGPATATLVTGYAKFWEQDDLDDVGTPFVALNAYGNHASFDEETAELRFSSNKGRGADIGGFIDWVAGMYFANYKYDASYNLGVGVAYSPPFPATGPINTQQSEAGGTKSEAAFSQVIFHFTKKLSGTFGIRQSWDQKTHIVQVSAGAPFVTDPGLDFSNLSLEGGLAYQITPRKLVYARFAEGYLAGGYDGFAAGFGYQPETNKYFEVGAKTDWLNKRLRFNISLFRNELSNLQVESAHNTPVPPYFVVGTENAGSAVSQGAEAQVVMVPIDNLTATLGGGYLDAHYSQNKSTTCSNDFTSTGTPIPADCSGINFPQAPKWTLNSSLEYVQDLPKNLGSLTFTGNYSYKSHLFTSDPVYPYSYQKGYGLLGAGVRFTDITDRYSVEVYGTNITGTKYDLGYSDPSGLGAWYERGRPPEWGLRLMGKF